MGSPNTGPLVPVTPGDGLPYRALHNNNSTAITVGVTVTSSHYGTQSYTLTIPSYQTMPIDCVVTSASAQVHGYPLQI